MEAKIDMERMVQDHEQRLTVLEKNYTDMQQKMQAVETGMHRVEKTLLVEGKEQKELINKQREEQDDLFKQLIGHTLGIKNNNNNKKWELALAVFGGGGLFYVIFDFFMNR